MHLGSNRYLWVVTTRSVHQIGSSVPLKQQRISQLIAKTWLISFRWWRTMCRRTRQVKMSALLRLWWKSSRISKSWRKLAGPCLPELTPNCCQQLTNQVMRMEAFHSRWWLIIKVPLLNLNQEYSLNQRGIQACHLRSLHETIRCSSTRIARAVIPKTWLNWSTIASSS